MKTMAWWGSGRIFTIHFPTLYLMTASAETKFSKSEPLLTTPPFFKIILTQQIQNTSANDRFFFISIDKDIIID